MPKDNSFPEELHEKDPLDEMETGELAAEFLRSSLKKNREYEAKPKLSPYPLWPQEQEYRVIIRPVSEAAQEEIQRLIGDGFLPSPMGPPIHVSGGYLVFIGCRRKETSNG